MYTVMLLVVGIISSLVFHPLFNSKAGSTYAERLNKIYGTYWAALIAHIIGAWAGDAVLGDWAWMAYGYNVIAGFIGAIVIGYIWYLIARSQTKAEVK
ncbi:hypothetical protein [Calorimonas adulescens]|uniref:Uncharacterized protein n=1 Tax=Calorimonas adulescens TaxID=2606906 RepID=A0A5D8Q9W3_9THEO|nr:hypothetical protein [Calorimonas adulescens]TZE81167.1 hypothetical protein FWJ32_10545 [Calorimonas adulescens]